MRISVRTFLGGVAVVLLAVPIWARPSSGRMDTAQWDPGQQSKIANMDFGPGSYELRVREMSNQVDVMRDGKVVAQVPCHWVELPKKSNSTEVMETNNQVTQVQFAGRTEAVQFR